MTQLDEWSLFKKKQPTDEFKEMHHTLEKHGYKTTDYKTYSREHENGGGRVRAHLRTSSIHDGKVQPGVPQVIHSNGGKRFQNHKDLDAHLKRVHSVQEEAPTNSMGTSSSTSGPINTYDPLLKTKKNKDKIDTYSEFRRKTSGNV